MGQKSRTKKQRTPQSSSVKGPRQVIATAPLLVKSSTTYQGRGPVVEDLLQVRRSDIRKIGRLMVVMAILLIGLSILNAKSGIFGQAGQHLAHTMRI